MEIIHPNKDKSNFSLEAEKRELWKIMVISGGIDILSTSGVIATMGLGVVVEELIENAISQMIAKYGKIELSKSDNLIGALPIPGVTAVTVHCAKRLLAIKAQEQLGKVRS